MSRVDSTTITLRYGARAYPALAALRDLQTPARHARRHRRSELRPFAADVVVLAGFAAALGADVATPMSPATALVYLLPIGAATWRFGGRLGAALAAIVALVPVALALAHPATDALARAAPLVVGVAMTARRRRAVQILIERDDLTGVLNRRGLIRAAGRAIARARRTGRPLSVAFLDLDDFKQLNDRRGHAAGDRALVEVARALAIDDDAIIARVGGDELVVLLPDRDRTAARVAVERQARATRSALRRAGFDLTFTAGLITFDRAPPDVESLLRPADDLLIHGKARRKATVWSRRADLTPDPGDRS